MQINRKTTDKMLSNTVTFYPRSKSIYELLCNEKYKTKNRI